MNRIHQSSIRSSPIVSRPFDRLRSSASQTHFQGTSSHTHQIKLFYKHPLDFNSDKTKFFYFSSLPKINKFIFICLVCSLIAGKYRSMVIIMPKFFEFQNPKVSESIERKRLLHCSAHCDHIKSDVIRIFFQILAPKITFVPTATRSRFKNNSLFARIFAAQKDAM